MSLIDDAALLKMAEAEILGEAKRAAVRHSIAGVSGWQPCSKLNKTFLTNTILQTLASNRIISKKRKNKTLVAKKFERKLLKTSIIEKGANFVYQKPIKDKEKSALNTISKKFKKKINASKSNKKKIKQEAKKICVDKNLEIKKDGNLK